MPHLRKAQIKLARIISESIQSHFLLKSFRCFFFEDETKPNDLEIIDFGGKAFCFSLKFLADAKAKLRRLTKFQQEIKNKNPTDNTFIFILDRDSGWNDEINQLLEKMTSRTIFLVNNLKSAEVQQWCEDNNLREKLVLPFQDFSEFGNRFKRDSFEIVESENKEQIEKVVSQSNILPEIYPSPDVKAEASQVLPTENLNNPEHKLQVPEEQKENDKIPSNPNSIRPHLIVTDEYLENLLIPLKNHLRYSNIPFDEKPASQISNLENYDHTWLVLKQWGRVSESSVKAIEEIAKVSSKYYILPFLFC